MIEMCSIHVYISVEGRIGEMDYPITNMMEKLKIFYKGAGRHGGNL